MRVSEAFSDSNYTPINNGGYMQNETLEAIIRAADQTHQLSRVFNVGDSARALSRSRW